MKIFRNIFAITFLMILSLGFYNNVGAMGGETIKLKKVSDKIQRLAELADEARQQARVDLANLIASEFSAGGIFYYGNGVPKDYKQALVRFANILEISKTQFIDKTILLSAYHFMGLIYLFGDDNVAKDDGKAFKIFNDIATAFGAATYNMPVYVDAVYRLGLMCYWEKKYRQALMYFQIVFNVPNIKKLYPSIYLDIKRILGVACLEGYGVEKNIFIAQLHFLDIITTIDAEKINPDALRLSQLYLKIIYFNELDTIDKLVTFHYKNIVNAINTQNFNTIDWINSHYFFVLSYWNGFNNISQNIKKALIHCFAILAARDVEKIAPEIFLVIHDFLGRAYFYGDGIKQNHQKAAFIFKKILDMPNSLAINSFTWLDAKEHLPYLEQYLGHNDDEIIDLLLENSGAF